MEKKELSSLSCKRVIVSGIGLINMSLSNLSMKGSGRILLLPSLPLLLFKYSK